MINLTKYEPKLIGRNRGIKNYQNMSKEALLNAIVKSERTTENLSQNGLERIARMQNLSQNDLEQITEINNLSLNKPKQIAKTRRIKTRKDASKEELLIALLKSNQSHVEFRKSEDNNAEIGETKKLFNELRNNFSKEEIKKNRIKFRLREEIGEYLKELEQKDTLTEQEKQEKNVYPRDYEGLKSF